MAQEIFQKVKKGSGTLNDPALKSDEAGTAASKVATFDSVRKLLLKLQTDFASTPPDIGKNPAKGSVLDGRDITFRICPNAPVKLFITAQTEIRAKRRLKELQSKGIPATYDTVLKDMRERDARDARNIDQAKEVSVVIDTSDLSQEQVFKAALALAEEKLGQPKS